MRIVAALAGAGALAGCAANAVPSRPVQPVRPVQQQSFSPAGLDQVMGRDAAQLIRLFGPPNADVTEGPGRKLQFSSGICVLDAYLYPKGGAPLVSWLDARQPDGSAIDRASCVAALSRRSGGK